MTQTDSESTTMTLVIGTEERERIDRCVAHAIANPRYLGEPFDGQQVVSFECGVWAMYSIDRMGGGNFARHLTVSITDPATGRPIVPDRKTVGMLARAFGFDAPTLGTTGGNPLVMHAVEVVEVRQ